MKQIIKVSEFNNQIIVGGIILGVCEGLLVALSHLKHEELIIWALMFAIIYITALLLSSRKMGTVIIYDDYAISSMPLLRQRCLIDFSKDVYYYVYIRRFTNYAKAYIIISNSLFSPPHDLGKDSMDYSYQIRVPYEKCVKEFLPKCNWINISENNH